MGEGTSPPVGGGACRTGEAGQAGGAARQVCPLCPGVDHSSSTPREVFF